MGVESAISFTSKPTVLSEDVQAKTNTEINKIISFCFKIIPSLSKIDYYGRTLSAYTHFETSPCFS